MNCIYFHLDVFLYVKFCKDYQMLYRYQEHEDGVHNFNDNWLLSLGVCDMIRKHIQVIECQQYSYIIRMNAEK
jgi:hypothetical protein